MRSAGTTKDNEREIIYLKTTAALLSRRYSDGQNWLWGIVKCALKCTHRTDHPYGLLMTKHSLPIPRQVPACFYSHFRITNYLLSGTRKKEQILSYRFTCPRHKRSKALYMKKCTAHKIPKHICEINEWLKRAVVGELGLWRAHSYRCMPKLKRTYIIFLQ